ncbi:MAG: DUF4129 domain-containing protein [Pseudomonadota bacterium]
MRLRQLLKHSAEAGRAACRASLAAVLLLALAQTPAAQTTAADPAAEEAQDAVEVSPHLTEAGQAYLQAAGQRVQTEVTYFDPRRAAPSFEAQARPEAAPATDASDTAANTEPGGLFSILPFSTIVILLSLTALAAIGFLFWRQSGGVTVSFRRTADGARRVGATRPKGSAARPSGPTLATPDHVAAILAQPNRQRALILLAQRALADAVAAQGLLLQDSWTARDAVHRLPADHRHRDALTALVLAAEAVQFGDRPVSEGDFAVHVDAVKPLFQELSA